VSRRITGNRSSRDPVVRRDGTSPLLAEAKRLRGFADRDDIQTAFDFHLADESSDDIPAAA